MTSGDRFDSMFAFYGEFYGVDPKLLKAQVEAESSMNPRAQSHAGAKGLAQFMPATWKEWASPDADPYNPEESIRAQARYLGHLLQQFGQTDLALAAYNWGPGNVRQHGLADAPTETRDYVKRILRLLA